MDTIQAFIMGKANRGKELMVFDWDEAARLIKKKKPKIAEAGLQGDWEWTGATIYKDGKIVIPDSGFFASTWATPLLNLDGEDIPCFKMQSEVPAWDAKTKWPESARKIIK